MAIAVYASETWSPVKPIEFVAIVRDYLRAIIGLPRMYLKNQKFI